MKNQRAALTSLATPALNSSSKLPPLWPPDPAPRRYCDADAEDEVRRSSSVGALAGGGDIGESLLAAAAADAVSLLPPVPAAAAAAAAAADTLAAADDVTTPVPWIGIRSFFSFSSHRGGLFRFFKSYQLQLT